MQIIPQQHCKRLCIKYCGWSQRKAEQEYNIPRSTLKNKLKGKHSKAYEGQTVLTAEEESLIAQHCIAVSDSGFPVEDQELRKIVKVYLDKKGLKISGFNDNYPGCDWAENFLKRQKQLANRFASNIKKSRASVNQEIIPDFFQNYKIESYNVPPANIWNYEETNLNDDPGMYHTLI